MNATDLAMLITALTSFGAMVFAGLAALNASRAKASSTQNAVHIGEVKEQVGVIEKQTNSMKDALVTANRSEGRHEGRAEGKKEAREDAVVAAAVTAAAVAASHPSQPMEVKVVSSAADPVIVTPAKEDAPQEVKVINTPAEKIPVIPHKP